MRKLVLERAVLIGMHTDEARELAHAICRFANLDPIVDTSSTSTIDTLKRYTPATFRTAARLLAQLDKQGW